MNSLDASCSTVAATHLSLLSRLPQQLLPRSISFFHSTILLLPPILRLLPLVDVAVLRTLRHRFLSPHAVAQPPLPTPPSVRAPSSPPPYSFPPNPSRPPADDEDGKEEEGPTKPPPSATAHQRALPFSSNGSKPTDMKDLIAGLYGSHLPSTPNVAEVGTPDADDDDGFGDDGWEFSKMSSSPGLLPSTRS